MARSLAFRVGDGHAGALDRNRPWRGFAISSTNGSHGMADTCLSGLDGSGVQSVRALHGDVGNRAAGVEFAILRAYVRARLLHCAPHRRRSRGALGSLDLGFISVRNL